MIRAFAEHGLQMGNKLFNDDGEMFERMVDDAKTAGQMLDDLFDGAFGRWKCIRCNAIQSNTTLFCGCGAPKEWSVKK